MKKSDSDRLDETGKLRRWVSNLQLESWQLELLITGFSIFLLASSIEGYDNFRRDFGFNKIRPDGGTLNPIVAVAIMFVINSVPIVLKFLLINLLVHLLLRGFWIGIVGLSSVSSSIHFDKLNLKGSFKKFIPNKVRPLDNLIVYLDKVSSVIFAYTYLLVFSIISVVLVVSVVFSLVGVIAWLGTSGANPAIISFGTVLVGVLIFLFFMGAIVFFMDTLLFSAFKKSKWFNVIYYPIYRFFSVISLSILYRSIYYHLITNFKKKQIITVALILLAIFFMTRRISNWNNYKFFPETRVISEHYMSRNAFDDTRGAEFVDKISLPSKFVKNGFLELFIRYQPGDNAVLEFLCSDAIGLNRGIDVVDGFKAGMEAQRDSTITIGNVLSGGEAYRMKVEAAVECAASLYEIKIDGETIERASFLYHIHSNRGEKGYLTVMDVGNLTRGQHLLEIDKQTFDGVTAMQTISADKINSQSFVKINFWIE